MRELLAMTEAAIHERALSEAVDWLVRHESAMLSETYRKKFEIWLNADVMHQAAWKRVNSAFEAPLNTVRSLKVQEKGVHIEAAMQTLLHTRRRVIRGALAIGGAAATSVLVADRLTPVGQLMADLHTGTSERREFILDDGLTVLLDARSAADVRHLSEGPQLLHRAGALIVKHTGAGELSLRSRDGLVQLGDGRVMSRIHPDRTEVVALEGMVTITPAEHSPRPIHAGYGISFSAQQVSPLYGNALDRAAWQQGMLAVDNWSLAEVSKALQPYFSGFIRVDPSVASLRVFGIFRLNVHELLSTLAQTLPIQVRRLGPVIFIDSRLAV